MHVTNTYEVEHFFFDRDEGRRDEGRRDEGRRDEGRPEEPWRRGGSTPDRKSDAPWRPSGQGGWREREKEKQESWKRDPEKRYILNNFSEKSVG